MGGRGEAHICYLRCITVQAKALGFNSNQFNSKWSPSSPLMACMYDFCGVVSSCACSCVSGERSVHGNERKGWGRNCHPLKFFFGTLIHPHSIRYMCELKVQGAFQLHRLSYISCDLKQFFCRMENSNKSFNNRCTTRKCLLQPSTHGLCLFLNLMDACWLKESFTRWTFNEMFKLLALFSVVK